MKFLTIIFQVFLSVLILTPKLFAQYDAGTIIHSETGTNLQTVLKNYQVVDFDGDNYVDIIMIKNDAANNTNNLTWYKGNGNGDFSPQTNLLSVNNNHKENEIFYEDMNGDGNKDIVFQNSDTDFTVLLNDGQGHITAQVDSDITTDIFLFAFLKEVTDLDGDGDVDLIFSNCTIGFNNGSGIFSSFTYCDIDIFEQHLLIETGDIDGDGNVDIVGSGSTSIGSPFVRLYKNSGSNTFPVEEEIATSLSSKFANIKIRDLDNNGIGELLIEYNYIGYIYHGPTVIVDRFKVLSYNTQTEKFIELEEYKWLHSYNIPGFSSSITNELYNNAFHIQFGNQNNDSNLDILSVNVPQGKLHWYNGDGNGGFSNGQVVNFNNQYSSIPPTLRAVDIDNDSDLDIFVLLNDDNSSTLTVFENLSQSPTCSPVLDLAGSFVSNGIYQASTTTLSNGHIIDGSMVTLKAGNRVKLESGFHIPPNSSVKVRIDPCN